MILGSKAKPAEKKSGHRVRIRHIFLFSAMILVLLAMISHSPQDWDALRGGINAPIMNWIGASGAYLSHILLMSCGIAGYILVILLLLRSFRLLLPDSGSNRNFISGVLLVTAGAMLLLALAPEAFANITQNLGLGRSAMPHKALSGGLIGQFFAAPPCPDDVPPIPAGWLRTLIGAVGTMVIGWIMVTAGGVILYISDWHNLIRLRLLSPGAAAAGEASRSLLKKLADRQAAKAAVRELENGRSYAVDEEDEECDDVEEPSGDIREAGEEEVPPVKSRSRLKDLLNSGMEFGEDELPLARNRSNPSISRIAAGMEAEECENLPEEKFSAAAAVAAKTPAVLETPEVSKKVVQNGEKIRGEHGDFILPLVSMLAQGKNVIGESTEAIELAKSKIQQTLEDFSIAGRVTGQVSGPRVTRYEITLDPGINVKKVEQIQDNIRMALAATSIRVLAPIPGRPVVGIEVSNSNPEAVFMRSVMESDEWKYSKAEIPIALGKNVSGKPVILDLAKAPHMLVAGATGTGKSVCSNSLIISLLFRFRPDELRLIMVDPKIVEFDAYKKLPHLLTPIINDSAKVPIALRWAANEMDRRYHILASAKVKKLSEFNNRPRSGEPEYDENGNLIPDKMPLLVIILDELADLMMTEAKKDVETNITRIAQKGRAAGIHIIVATQRPSTNIITGVIKANLPTRLCFQVRSLVDSRVVLDTPGAEKLLGMGDMLVMTSSSMEIERVQGAWVKDDDIQNVVKFVSDQAPQKFNDTVLADTEDNDEEIDEDLARIDPEDRADIAPLVQKHLRPGDDDIMRRALEVVILDRKASTSYLQRRLKIGYNRAAELVDQMEERGIVGPPSGSGNKRDILIFDGFDIG